MPKGKSKLLALSAYVCACFIFAPNALADTERTNAKAALQIDTMNIIVSNNVVVNDNRSMTRKETLSKARMTKAQPLKQTANSVVTYQVKQGDTLTIISKQYNVSIDDLIKWNQLASADLIYVGQTLKIYPSSAAVVNENQAVETEKTASEASAIDKVIEKQLANERMIQSGVSEKGQAIYQNVLNLAYELIGTPYVYGGNTPEGFDCSGFVRYVFFNAGLNIERKSSEDYFMKDTTIVENPVPGDVVFFKNTIKEGISHMGIYIGDGKFIHAGTDGVEISKLDYAYWKTRFVAFKRFNLIK